MYSGRASPATHLISLPLIGRGGFTELMNHRDDDNMYPIEDQEISGDLNAKLPRTYLGAEMIQR